ncbi:MAG TPA: prolyl oligopeptidase family serine peptidase [Verrucomicrobiae bacterium]|nr:prolyl oligopeptidase family serine peptidase [Verrucomicrobiae bacterium]
MNPIHAQDQDAEGLARWKKLEPFFHPSAVYQDQPDRYASPLKFSDGRWVDSPAAWNRRRQEILRTWHEIMGAWPPLIAHPKLERMDTVRRENFLQTKVRLEISPGQMSDGYLLVPDGKGQFPAVLVPFYEPETSIGRGKEFRDFGYQLARRGFVTLSIGSPGGDAREPVTGIATCQPLSYLAYVAANAGNALADLPQVDAQRLGVVGHSYGGKWAMFASCLHERFACAAWSDPGIVFDESRSNVNYWDRWYLGAEPDRRREPGIPSETNPRTGAYKKLMEEGHDLHELHVLMAPRPFLVSGGSEDPPERWRALRHSVEVNRLLDHTNRVAMTNRRDHSPDAESNEQIYLFFEHFLKGAPDRD